MYVENFMSEETRFDCPNCHATEGRGGIGKDFAQVLDQFATSIEDTIENQVNHRPAAGQPAVCTP